MVLPMSRFFLDSPCSDYAAIVAGMLIRRWHPVDTGDVPRHSSKHRRHDRLTRQITQGMIFTRLTLRTPA